MAADEELVALVDPAPRLGLHVGGPAPEFGLLLACCLGFDGDRKLGRIQHALSQPLDWPQLLHLAEHHRVVPYVYRNLAGLVPGGGIDILRQAYTENVRKTLRLTGELICIAEHLQLRGIDVLPYKGPVLGQLLYDDVGQRQFCDLDILVAARQVPRAKRVLAELQYYPHIDLAAEQEHTYLASGYEHSFDGPPGPNLLELQWQITPRFYSVNFDLPGFFKRSVELQLAGRVLRTLCNEDLFLVLCVHAAKHAWSQLSFLCDLSRMIATQPLEWRIVMANANKLGIARIVGMNLILAHQLLGSPLPLAAHAAISDAQTAGLAEAVRLDLLASREHNPESLAYFRFVARLRERAGDRLRIWWRLLSTPSVNEWSAVKLPSSLFGLYRAVRLVRLAKRAASA